jgi:putative tricarboxylic transport membrane protein
MSWQATSRRSEREVVMKHPDIASGLFWLVIGLGLSLWSLSAYEIGRLTEPGTGFLPLALGVILLLLALTVLAGQWRKKKDPEPVETLADWRGGGKVAGTILVMAVAALLFEALGVLLTFFLLIVLLMKGVERQGWKRALITALLTTAGVYVLFVLLLEVQLPQGIFGA